MQDKVNFPCYLCCRFFMCNVYSGAKENVLFSCLLFFKNVNGGIFCMCVLRCFNLWYKTLRNLFLKKRYKTLHTTLAFLSLSPWETSFSFYFQKWQPWAGAILTALFLSSNHRAYAMSDWIFLSNYIFDHAAYQRLYYFRILKQGKEQREHTKQPADKLTSKSQGVWNI